MATRPRPRYTWRMFEQAAFGMGSGGLVTVVLDSVGGAPDLTALGIFGDYTVRRVLGKIWATSSNAAESGGIDIVTWGLLVADADAVAGAALPNPVTDAADWFGFGAIGVSMQGGFSAGVHPLHEVPLESRAMRKVNENNQQVIVRLAAAAANVASVSVQMSGRFLVSRGG